MVTPVVPLDVDVDVDVDVVKLPVPSARRVVAPVAVGPEELEGGPDEEAAPEPVPSLGAEGPQARATSPNTPHALDPRT